MSDPLQPLPPASTNGDHPAPRLVRGAAFVATAEQRAPPPPARLRPVTVFPPLLPTGGLDGVLYLLGRATVLEVSLLRVAWIVGALLALIWWARGLPGGAWAAGALLTALLLATLLRARAAAHGFAPFTADLAAPGKPTAHPAPLPAAEKLPVYIWGRLEVGERGRVFAALPGFYRTFGTREHALIGQCAPRRVWGVAAWPAAELGLWYAFWLPAAQVQVQRGTLRWGRARYPALKVVRRTTHAKPAGPGRAQQVNEALCIVAHDPATIARIAADLQAGIEGTPNP